MSSKIYNVRRATFDFLKRDEMRLLDNPSAAMAVALPRARAAGHRFAADGRGVAPWMPNKKGFRIVRGKYVPRFAHRTA